MASVVVARVVRPLLLILLLALVVAFAAAAGAQDGPAGVWEGAIQVPNQALAIVVTLHGAEEGAWSGTIDIPAQNLTGFPLSDVAVTADSVTFAMAGVPGDPVFNGTWDGATRTISGDFRQGGGAFPFSLERTGDAEIAATEATGIDPETAAKVAGTWSGTLDAGGATLRIVFHLDAGADGSLSGTMDSPDQGQTGLAISTVAFDGTTLRLDLTYAAAYFEGDLSADGASVVGNWNQGGASVPLTVTRQ